MLVILSPGYLASDWCEWERETFLEIIQKQKNHVAGDTCSAHVAR